MKSLESGRINIVRISFSLDFKNNILELEVGTNLRCFMFLHNLMSKVRREGHIERRCPASPFKSTFDNLSTWRQLSLLLAGISKTQLHKFNTTNVPSRVVGGKWYHDSE